MPLFAGALTFAPRSSSSWKTGIAGFIPTTACESNGMPYGPGTWCAAGANVSQAFTVSERVHNNY